jgi:hypothetical protein
MRHFTFIHYVLAHWIAAMSGAISLAIALYQAFRSRAIESRTYFIVAGLFIFVACDSVWQDEHRNTQTLITEKAALWSERDFWKQQSYQKDGTLREQGDLLTKNVNALTETQKSYADLSNRLLDVAGPAPSRLNVFRWKVPLTYDFTNTGKVQFWTLVIVSNKVISPVKGTISCAGDFQIIETTLMTKTSSLRAAYDTLSPKTVHVDFVYPPLSSENPLVFWVFAKENADIGDCSFKPDK